MNGMRRSDFLRAAGLIGSATALPGCQFMRRVIPGDFDVVLRGGTVVDGSGEPGYRADVGIAGDRIAAIGDLAEKSAGLSIDAREKIVCPGFIDLHSHSDLTALGNSAADSKIRQGVTTEVVGQDGNSMAPIGWMRSAEWSQALGNYGLSEAWRDFDGYFAALRENGAPVNIVSLVGASTIRRYVAEINTRPLSDWELDEALRALEKAHSQGGKYLSAGLEYIPGAYATERELVTLARKSRLYVTHMRNEDDRVIEALREAISIARKSGAALHVSHIKAQGRRNWNKLSAMLAMMDEARGWRTKITCDRYPYLAYNNGLMNLFPLGLRQGGNAAGAARLSSPATRREVRPAVQRKIDSLGSYNAVMLSDVRGAYAAYSGRRLGDLARSLGRDAFDVLCDIVIAHGGGGTMVGFAMSEENLIKLLRYPYCAIATDGAALNARSAGRAHPRNFGSFPRVLGTYVRDKNVLSLPEAVRKMSGLPAEILGLRDRGLLGVGKRADVVVFDPIRVADRATYLKPAYPTGIEHVFVNGAPVVYEADPTGTRPGRPLLFGDFDT
ncbi:MAG: D-aminoacylase [Leptospirales bacterium]|jgi:N-acyl-D-amino-acid deacylase